MPTVQTSDGFTVTSNHETADGMKQALTSAKTTVQEIPPTTSPTPPKPPPPQPKPPAAATTGADAAAIEEPVDPNAPPPTPGEQRRKAERSSVQARIDRAVAAQRDAERERDHWKQQAATSPRAAAPPPDRQPPAAPRPHPGFDPRDPEPVLDAFANDPDPVISYVRELGLWSGRQEVRASMRAQQRQTQQHHADAREQQRAERFATKISEAMTGGDPDRLPEFLDTLSDDVIHLQTFAQLPPGAVPTGATAVADYIVDAATRDDGAPHLLMRYFTDHPDDLQRLSALPPSVAFGQMGRIEERLIAAHPSGPAQTPVSRARSPIKPVAGSQRIVSDSAPKDTDDLATFIKKGNALDPRINPKIA